MPKTLIIHHLEPMWESGYKRFYTSFDDLQSKVLAHINRASYNQIILTRFEDCRATEMDGYYSDFLAKINKVFEYGYGWEADQIESDPSRFIPGGRHSEAVMIDDWMLDLPKKNVSICGAFEGECIEDLEIALNHVGVKYKKLKNLIV